MMRFSRPQPSPAAPLKDHAKEQSDTVRNLPALAERHDLATVPAAWPTGISPLAIAVEACQRCEGDELCGDWLARG